MILFYVFYLIVVANQALTQKDNFFHKDRGNVFHMNKIVGGSESVAPPEDAPVAYVVTQDNLAAVYGARDGVYPNSYYRFYGLRYAEPPVGRLRFQRPRKMKLKGAFRATKMGAPCPQPDPDNPEKMIGSEDCLFLNIYTPRLPSSDELLPVLVWIHGGGFRRGSANQYGGGYLARRDIVVVTVQYRLGSLGFMSSEDKNMPGNMAMFDMGVALEWVKEYIRYFGGDPDNVVTSGQGTGASSASLLGLSNVTQPSVQGIIAMSGSSVSPFAIHHEPADSTLQLAKRNNCPDKVGKEMVRCLQQLNPEQLVTADSWLEDSKVYSDDVSKGLGAPKTPAPVVEGQNDQRFLPSALEEKPITSFENRHVPKIPLFTGVTKHETAGAILKGGRTKKLIDKIKSIPNYIDQVLVKDLMQETAKNVYSQAEKQLNALKQISSNYLKLRVPGTNTESITAILNQIVEVTTDALFNFPAVLSSKTWKDNGVPTYFYSFDHIGKVKGSDNLLKGTEFNKGDDASSTEDIQAATHGSELPYLFDVRSLEGVPDPVQNESTPLSPEDSKVRDLLTNMIASFTKHKSVDVDGGKAAEYPSFVSVQPQPKQESNFRNCQMSLWLGEGQNLQNKVCDTFSVISSQLLGGVKGLSGTATGTLGSLQSGAQNLGNLGKLGNKAQTGLGSVFGLG